MYRGRLSRDLDRWVGKGLLARPVADALLKEYDERESAFSIGSVLMILAAVLLSASILLLVAANWEDIPRLVRVIGIFALIWIFHLAGAFTAARGAGRLSAAFLVLGCASFGAAIALVGQLYHLSGDAADAMLLWFAMTVVSAALFRSGALTGAAGLLSWAFFTFYVVDFDARWIDFYAWSVVLAGLVQIPLIVWTGAHRAQHLVYLLALAFLFWLYAHDGAAATAMIYVAVGLALFVAVTLRASPLTPLASATGASPAFYSFALSLMGLLFVHAEYWDDGVREQALIAIATVAAVILALALAARDNGAVRYLAYTAFAIEILYLSYQTIDSMLGTAGFFLLSGFVVALLAFVVIRMEKIFAARAAKEAA